MKSSCGPPNIWQSPIPHPHLNPSIPVIALHHTGKRIHRLHSQSHSSQMQRLQSVSKPNYKSTKRRGKLTEAQGHPARNAKIDSPPDHSSSPTDNDDSKYNQSPYTSVRPGRAASAPCTADRSFPLRSTWHCVRKYTCLRICRRRECSTCCRSPCRLSF